MLYLIPAAAVIAALLLLLPMLKKPSASHAKKRLLANGAVFATAAAMMVTLSVGVFAEAAPADTNAVVPVVSQSQAAASDNNQGMGFLAAALATGLSCIGAGIAIASTAPAAIGAFSEDPKAFGKALIFVVLGEGVALYGLLISILLINKL